MEEWTEEAYDREVARLIMTGLRCPTCNASPVEIESIEFGGGAMVTCRRGHSFATDPNEED